MTTKHQGGMQYFPTDWNAPCEARCRKTGAQCQHKCTTQVPNTIAARQTGADYYQLSGRPARLCRSHCRSFHLRAKRLLSLPLIDGGHLSPYNAHGFGSVVVTVDRINFTAEKATMKIPPAWGWIGWRGILPEGILERVPQFNPTT